MNKSRVGHAWEFPIQNNKEGEVLWNLASLSIPISNKHISFLKEA